MHQNALVSVTSVLMCSGTHIELGWTLWEHRLVCPQKVMRHADIRTTMNIYADAVTTDMRSAHEKVLRLAMPNGLN